MPEERRVVTVLFADVAGSTALADASDPEDVRALMAAYYALATRVVEAHGGTLEKFIGDAVMAVFGVPQAHDDDPDRALAAALALRESAAADPATSGLGLRIGVNTGEVIAAREPGRDFLVTGDAVNVAARLQQAAAPGEIVAGARTLEAAGPRFRFGAARALELKGKPEPVRCATLEGIASDAPARRSAGPFVGRTSDLAQLALAAQRAFQEARPQLVTISAPAGTGKSRLLEQFAADLRTTRADLRVATAQCLPFGAAITYLPLRGLLAGLLDVRPDALSIATVREALSGRGVEAAEAERVATLVGATLGLATEIGPREREEFFTAWRAAVEGLAAAAPTLLVLEDLHWASDSLLDLIEHVVQPRTRAPLLMVALTRPELFDRRATWGTARRNATSIALEPLDADDAARLVAALLPDAAPALRSRIAERAEGNPFFAAELARSYREHGDDAHLPDTVQATMLARLDLLPAGERRTLQLGAVAGRTIAPDAAAQLLGESAARSLDALAERDLLVPQADGAYTFRHIVIRDVAYGTLTRGERASAHLTLARWLESLDDSGPELIAHHYRQAIAHSPRGLPAEDVQRAIAALTRAATFAKRTGAVREALALLRDALRIAPPAEQLGLQERLGDVAELTDDALAAFTEAFTRWEALPDGQRDGRTGARLLRKRLIVVTRWGGSTRELMDGVVAHALLTRARALLPPDERYERARLDLCEAFMTNPGGRAARTLPPELRRSLPEAEDLAAAARAELARAGDRAAELEALDALGVVVQQRGRYDEAVALAEERLRFAETSLLERGDAVAMLGWAHLLAGRYDEAVEAVDRYIATLRPGEPEGFYPFPHQLSIAAARTGGRWDDALRLADRVLAATADEQRGPLNPAPIVVHCYTNAAYIAAARLDQARLQMYRSACAHALVGVADDAGPARAFRLTFEEDADGGLRTVETASTTSILAGHMLAQLLFDFETLVPESMLAAIEARDAPRAGIVTARIALIRAARSGPQALRAAITALEHAGIHGDAPRAAGLLARLTGDPADRADAERRLRALGDAAYLARLAEPAELREP